MDDPDAAPDFSVDLPQYEGPLDLLLDLVRARKLDVHALSLVAVTGAFLRYVREGGVRRLDDTAVWLSVAATLTWIKSRIFVDRPDEANRAREVADDLAVRLRRIEIVRETARVLDARTVVGRDVFGPGGAVTRNAAKRTGRDLANVLRIYAEEASRGRVPTTVTDIHSLAALSVQDAIDVIVRETGDEGWRTLAALAGVLPSVGPERARVAAAYVAALELARTGGMAIRQAGPVVEVRRASKGST